MVARSPPLDRMIAHFQADYGVPAREWFDQTTDDELERVHREGVEAALSSTDGNGFVPITEPLDYADP